MIDSTHEIISVSRQCELLDLSRSSYYYASERDDSYNQILMNRIDEQFTKTPFYGLLQMPRLPSNPPLVWKIHRVIRLSF